jgi:hypothetical protein
MKYGVVSLGKIEALLNKIGGEEGMRRLLAGELKVVPVGNVAVPVKKQGFLVRDGSFSSVDLTERFDPRKFYQTREGLYVWSDFTGRIVAVAKPTEAGRKFKKVSCWKLEKSSTGEMLKNVRPNDIWTATDFCAWLSAKLTKQPNGEEGELLNNGWANLFLVEGASCAVFVVYVGWDSIDRKWLVHAWNLGYEWYAGHRFVSKPIAL